jgi:hypothetical protein
MLFRDTVLKYLFVIAMGAIVFFVDSLEFVDSIFTKLLILLLVVFKSIFFFIQSYKKIVEVTKNNVAYHNFLVFMAINIALIILSFAVDFLCLYQVEPLSFKGMDTSDGFYRKCFEMVYFSMLNFSNFGFGEVMPSGMLAKGIVSFEIIISFITIIFILSDFISLKESISKRSGSFLSNRKKPL